LSSDLASLLVCQKCTSVPRLPSETSTGPEITERVPGRVRAGPARSGTVPITVRPCGGVSCHRHLSISGRPIARDRSCRTALPTDGTGASRLASRAGVGARRPAVEDGPAEKIRPAVSSSGPLVRGTGRRADQAAPGPEGEAVALTRNHTPRSTPDRHPIGRLGTASPGRRQPCPDRPRPAGLRRRGWTSLRTGVAGPRGGPGRLRPHPPLLEP